MLGKIDSPLNQKLAQVKWGEFKLSELFDITTSKSIDKNKITLVPYGAFDFIGRSRINNGVQGTIDRLSYAPNPKETFSLVQVGESVCLYRNRDWYASQNIFVLNPHVKELSKSHIFITTSINKALSEYASAYTYPTLETIKNITIFLPLSGSKIDFEFIDGFVAELEGQRVAELQAYLSVTGLSDYTLTTKELKALEDFNNCQWKLFNLEALFGKATRGKRLKGNDRIDGTLPFVTAGEANEGISAFIGNNVHIFSKNTTTIDMFGSAKYRNYNYGGDDHIAVVHTEELQQNAAIFVTSAIHKSSHNGQFNYGHNFYAKDADELNIMLPTKGTTPDYQSMAILISAIKKLVIKDVVNYADKKITLTKKVISQS